MVRRYKGIKKMKVFEAHPRGVCDFCHKKGQSYKLISEHRKYRFIVVCEQCLTKIRSSFRKKK